MKYLFLILSIVATVGFAHAQSPNDKKPTTATKPELDSKKSEVKKEVTTTVPSTENVKDTVKKQSVSNTAKKEEEVKTTSKDAKAAPQKDDMGKEKVAPKAK